MRFNRREALLGSFCLCCLPRLGRAAAFKVEEVAPGVFIRRGVDEDATPQNRDAIANIGFIVGRDSVLVTDSGGSLGDGLWLRETIKATTSKPVKYVVLSHIHPDHIFGAAAFVPDDPVFIGHAKLRAALEMRGEFYRSKLSEIVGVDQIGPLVRPTLEITDAGEIDLGGRIIGFKAHGPAHTTCDLSMLDRQSGLLLPADLLFVSRIPSLDGSLLGWLAELEALKAMGAAKAVPGHGPVCVDFSQAASDLRRYLTTLRDGVRAEIKQDGSIQQAIKTVAAGERSNWLLFDDYNVRNVTQAYKELEWE
ncbi:MAG: quinoprotein relay system zinc metallohydrolase 2 [Beijerinckiaceae bacterium]|jgi:quinoprotein relay system zinc metallohydrolase 2